MKCFIYSFASNSEYGVEKRKSSSFPYEKNS
jgi:hypothetical protein